VTEQDFSASFERLASARPRAIDPGVSFQKVREAKPVLFLVLFPRNAFDWRASVSFASWIALETSLPWARFTLSQDPSLPAECADTIKHGGPCRVYHLRPWLADMSQLDHGSVSLSCSPRLFRRARAVS